MVRGLLMPNLAGPAPVTGDGAGHAIGTDVPDADLPEFTRLVQSFTVTDQTEQPWLQAAKLTVTAAELRLIEDISALIGTTPRAVKRLINIYLLLKSVGLGRGWPIPQRGQIAVLLAIATRLPTLANELLPRVATGQYPTLRTALTDPIVAEAHGPQFDRLNTWLAEHPTWYDVSIAGMEHWIDLILRFRFDRVPAKEANPPISN
jgi:hypothetical protein